MNFRLFYCPAGWDYPNLFYPYAPWVIAEWQPEALGGIWYKLDACQTADYATTKLSVYRDAHNHRAETEDKP